MLNSVSCHVECWNMPFNTLNIVERCWTKIETSSIPFNTFVQHCSTFVEQQTLQDVEPFIIGLRKRTFLRTSRTINNMAATNLFIPNAQEFFVKRWSCLCSQCTAEQSREIRRNVRINAASPQHDFTRWLWVRTFSSWWKPLRQILLKLESLYCNNNEKSDIENSTAGSNHRRPRVGR